MRRHWTLAPVLVVAVAAGAAPGRSAGGHCSGSLPQGPAGLPAAVVVTTDCGSYRLEPNRSVVYEGPWKSPVPKMARAYWMDLTWYGIEHRHLLIGRGMKRLWRSQDIYPHSRYLDVGAIALGRRGLAFSYYEGRRSRVLVARYGGRERLIARGETPLEFTDSGGLVTWREHGGALLLRSDGGRLVRRLAARAIEPQVDRESRLVVFRAHRHLFVLDGTRVRDLLSLPKAGVTGAPVVEPLGRLVAVHDLRRLVVMGYDGRLFASTAVARRGVGVASPMAADASETAVAFTEARSRSATNETVYVLRAGEKKAKPIFTESLDGNGAGGCGGSAWLAWQGRWLLYGDPQQRAAVVDSSGQASPVELGDVIAKLPGIRTDGEGSFDVSWS